MGRGPGDSKRAITIMIGLMDCNSFYCSCERIFRPELMNKPVVVLSNNDGCAVSRTDEAKKLGIKMGQAFFEFTDLCKTNGLIVFSSNFPLYTNLSDRVMQTLKDNTPQVEVYSVDEAFLKLDGIKDFNEFGLNLKRKIEKNIGIPVSVGISKTKTLAKVANKIAKIERSNRGVVTLETQAEIDNALKDFPIEDVWGIGRASSLKMKLLSIKSAYDFANYKNEKLILKTFTKTGLITKHELQGIQCHPFGAIQEKKKEIMCSRSFASPKWEKFSLKESMATYISMAAEKMRKQGSYCSRLDVFFWTSPFQSGPGHQVFESSKFSLPTLDTLYLIETALELVERSFKHGYAYKKAGIKLSNFSDHGEVQLGLFNDHEDLKDRNQLMAALDMINSKVGEGSIGSAACGTKNHKRDTNQTYKSPRYLTSWRELKEVH